MANNNTANTPPGPGVDASGQSVIDPTANVLHALDAAAKRLDDLREAAVKRVDDLRECESRHIVEVSNVRADFGKQLRQAETARIDAIRAVDIAAVNRAAEVAAGEKATLATQVAVSAETLRTQVAATATAGTVALAAALDPIQKDIADLRRAQYEAQGQKTQVIETRDATAEMKPILDAIQNLTRVQSEAKGGKAQVVETQARSSNLGLWVGLAIAAIVGFSSVVLAAGGVAVAVMLR